MIDVEICQRSVGRFGVKMFESTKTDVLIVGSGCSALYFAMRLPQDINAVLITKSDFESSDSFLAQGGICMLNGEDDFESFFEDTLKAGHYENDEKSVEIMIRSSLHVIENLIEYGVDFERDEDGRLCFTREGCHSNHRILYHKDITGEEITKKLLSQVKKLRNIRMYEYTALLDIVSENNTCFGGIIKNCEGTLLSIEAKNTVLATGGIGGLYAHSTNFPHLTGDAIAIALNHGIELRDINYVQVHPTTFFSEKPGDRSFLISESARGEGAKLYDRDHKRFTDELLPRDLLTADIRDKMKEERSDFVWEDLRRIGCNKLKRRFPNIMEYCLNRGYDPTQECIPVVPAQHYLMGGIKTDHSGLTSMKRLYAVGETACNGVHGKNRLASNSLLEAMVFAGRAADAVARDNARLPHSLDLFSNIDFKMYMDYTSLTAKYAHKIQDAITCASGGSNLSGVPYKDFEKSGKSSTQRRTIGSTPTQGIKTGNSPVQGRTI